MTTSASLAALYNAAEIILWVEDLVTAAYLGELWAHDPRVGFCVGGGQETLMTMVEDARRSGRRGVFGLCSRTFGASNRAHWSSPEPLQCFALETFEVECFLLDPVALAACAVNTARRSEAEIGEHLAAQAAGLLWCMASRSVLAELRDARRQGFPGQPKRAVIASRRDAEDILLGNEWVMTTAPGLTARVEAQRLSQALVDAHERYAQHLTAGTWTAVFSGKELVSQILSWIWTSRRPAGNAAHEDLAKAVAQAQRDTQRAPVELLELREALLARGLA